MIKWLIRKMMKVFNELESEFEKTHKNNETDFLDMEKHTENHAEILKIKDSIRKEINRGKI